MIWTVHHLLGNHISLAWSLSIRKHILFRTFCEGNKIFVVQKQMNGRCNFVIVTVLGDSKGRGCVIIPEGRDGAGGF